MPKTIFGRLDLGKPADGENPNGFVSQTSNGTNINGAGSDGVDWTWGPGADGPRWNKESPQRMADVAIARPVAIVASRRR
jgi:hypothetical protein